MSSQSPIAGGNVTKALLLIPPAFAREQPYLHYLKHQLYEKGFVVVRDEYHFFNVDQANHVCLTLDHAHMDSASAAVPEGLLPRTPDMVGSVFVFAVARRDCHACLQQFVREQITGEKAEYLEVALEECTRQGREAPMWVHRTAEGAAKAVSLLFPRLLNEKVPSGPQSRAYVEATLKEALTPALTELAREKPEDPIKWLATRLLMSNTKGPMMAATTIS